MRRASRMLQVVVALALAALTSMSPAAAQTVVFHATATGGQTLDDGEGGGNPLASSLIELLDHGPASLSQIATAVPELTRAKSRGFQQPETPRLASARDEPVLPLATPQSGTALVLAISDYSRTGGAQSLPGARHDAERLATALARAGFATRTALDLDVHGIRQELADFATASTAYDTALIYTTGHGLERDGRVYLLAGDYPLQQRAAALPTHGVPVAEIARAARAKRVNLVFYGGCRDDPFAP